MIKLMKKVLIFIGWILSLFLVGLLVYMMKPAPKNNKSTTSNTHEIKSSRLFKQDRIKIKSPFEDRNPLKTIREKTIHNKYFIH